MALKLYGYFRSSAAFRVRIALNLNKLDYEERGHYLRRNYQTSPITSPSTRRLVADPR